MTHNKLRPLTESSLLTAITVIIALAGLYIPFVILFWTLPLTIITTKHNLKYGIYSALISGIILCLFLTPVSALPFIASSVPLALTLGVGFRFNWSAAKIFATSFIAALLGTALFLSLTFYLTGINIFFDQINSFKTAMIDTNQTLSSMGANSEAMVDVNQQANNLANILTLILPMVFVLNSLFSLVLNYFASFFILKRLGHTQISTLPPFTQWHFPKVFVYIYAFSLIGMYWGDTRSIALLYQAALNVYLFANVIGLIQGLSVIRFFFKLKNWPTTIWIFIIVMLLINLIITQIVALSGLFDMIFDYRRRFKAVNK